LVIKSQFSRLTVGLLMAIGTMSYVSPSFAAPSTQDGNAPKGYGIVTYDATSNKINYLISVPNSSVQNSGTVTYNPNTSQGSVNGSYTNPGGTGTYSNQFPASNVQGVPEPNSSLVNTLAFGAVIGGGLLLKRRKF